MKNVLRQCLFKNQFFKNQFKCFTRTTSFSFKNKINLFYKHVHPDVLGSECPSEYRKTNESSVKELNNYIETLGKTNTKYDNKIIDFYIKVEEKDDNSADDKLNIVFSKISINLEKVEPATQDSTKIGLQMK
jgi:hypothetical protein